MYAFAFPGQGTLRVGMASWLRRRQAAANVLNAIDDLLDRPLLTLLSRGPTKELIDTHNAQPAVTMCNIAALVELRANGIEPGIVAGHSVGEFTALHAAGVLDLEETMTLVRDRAEIMAGVSRVGGMGSVMGMTVPDVEARVAAVSSPSEPLVVAIENGDGHTVVSGAFEALDKLEAELDGDKALRRLEVSNAFHSPLFSEAAEQWRARVMALRFRAPDVPVVTNVSGEPTRDPEVLREHVSRQLTERVRWTATLRAFGACGAEFSVECGDSKTLTKIARTTGDSWYSMSEPSTPKRLLRAMEKRAAIE